VGAGNAQISVTNETVDNGIQVQLQAAAGGDATIQSILGLTLNQIISKGVAFDAATRTLTFTSALFSDFAIATIPPATPAGKTDTATTDASTADSTTNASAAAETTEQTKALASTGDDRVFGIAGLGFVLTVGVLLVLACRRRA
jgi:uncharacterized surface anchored protein